MLNFHHQLTLYLLNRLPILLTPVSITSIFPEPGKRASVTPIDENGAYKHFSKNYRPVNELSTFSKILDS